MPPRKNTAAASKTAPSASDTQSAAPAKGAKKVPADKKTAPTKKGATKKGQFDTTSTPASTVVNTELKAEAPVIQAPESQSVADPTPTAEPAVAAKTSAKAVGEKVSKDPVKPKPKTKKAPKSPMYVSSGSEGDEPVKPLVFPDPPQTPKKETRKRPALNYAESDSDCVSNPSPKKKSRAAVVIKDEVEDEDEDPLNEGVSNLMVDDIAEEDNEPEAEEAATDAEDGMDVDEEGDDCEEEDEEGDEEEQEPDGNDDAGTKDEEAEDDEGEEVVQEEEVEEVEDDEEAEEEEMPMPSSDLTALPEDEWDEEAFYLESVPTEKNASDIKPGTLPPYDMSVSPEAMDPELVQFKVYDEDKLSHLVPGCFVAPANANIDLNDEAMTIMNVDNWLKMGVLYTGAGSPPHRRAMHLKEFARIVSFKQAYCIASPALADPTKFVAKFIGNFNTNNESLRWEAHLNGYTCLFVDAVGVTDSHLKTTTNAFGTSLRYITAIDHRFFLERKKAFFNTIFRKRELELRMIDATTYSYETKSVNTGSSSTTPATPKKNVFGSSAKLAYNASPVKASTASPAKARSNRPHTFDANEDVPIYDGTNPKKPVPTGFKMMDLGKHLDPWTGEVPDGALALIGYIAQMFHWRDAWRLKFYVQWVVVLGVPGKSVNDALKDANKKPQAKTTGSKKTLEKKGGNGKQVAAK